MQLKELTKFYKVEKSKINNVYDLYSLDEPSKKFNGTKYICSVLKNGNSFSLYNKDLINTEYNKINDLINDINTYLSNLKFSSENFHSGLRKYIDVELCIRDHMLSLGFIHNGAAYVYKKQDVFDFQITMPSIIINDMNNDEKDTVNIIYANNNFSYHLDCIKKTTDAIIRAIDSFVYFSFSSNIINMIKSIENIDTSNIDKGFKAYEYDGFDSYVIDYKKELYTKLSELISE